MRLVQGRLIEEHARQRVELLERLRSANDTLTKLQIFAASMPPLTAPSSFGRTVTPPTESAPGPSSDPKMKGSDPRAIISSGQSPPPQLLPLITTDRDEPRDEPCRHKSPSAASSLSTTPGAFVELIHSPMNVYAVNTFAFRPPPPPAAPTAASRALRERTSNVTYTEPSLRAKMRRPTAPLVSTRLSSSRTLIEPKTSPISLPMTKPSLFRPLSTPPSAPRSELEPSNISRRSSSITAEDEVWAFEDFDYVVRVNRVLSYRVHESSPPQPRQHANLLLSWSPLATPMSPQPLTSDRAGWASSQPSFPQNTFNLAAEEPSLSTTLSQSPRSTTLSRTSSTYSSPTTAVASLDSFPATKQIIDTPWGALRRRHSTFGVSIYKEPNLKTKMRRPS